MPSSRIPSLSVLFMAFGISGCALAVGAAVYAGTRVGAGLERDAGAFAARRGPAAYGNAPPAFVYASPATSGRARFPSAFDPALFRPDPDFRVPDPELLAARMADRAFLSTLPGNAQVLAFYGHPGSRSMGILGRYPKEELGRLVKEYARLYDESNGELGVVPAFYLIYGTCWPGGEIGYLKDSIVEDYIEYARKEGMLVFVDHQIGKYGVEAAIGRLLPWLRYPNVQLAIDPEWRTSAPMLEIGAVTADELNLAQELMSRYMKEKGVAGTRMLVVHQFNAKMIRDRDSVLADYEGVILVHTSDGFGPPEMKKGAYAFNAKARNMPVKGFKLFFKSDVAGAGYDEPLLEPAQVSALDPRPVLVIYQ